MFLTPFPLDRSKLGPFQRQPEHSWGPRGDSSSRRRQYAFWRTQPLQHIWLGTSHYRGGPMIPLRTGALWAGWSGTLLFIICWPLIRWTATFSFLLWLGLMLLGAILCVVGGIYRSKWFLRSEEGRRGKE